MLPSGGRCWMMWFYLFFFRCFFYIYVRKKQEVSVDARLRLVVVWLDERKNEIERNDLLFTAFLSTRILLYCWRLLLNSLSVTKRREESIYYFWLKLMCEECKSTQNCVVSDCERDCNAKNYCAGDDIRDIFPFCNKLTPEYNLVQGLELAHVAQQFSSPDKNFNY